MRSISFRVSAFLFATLAVMIFVRTSAEVQALLATNPSAIGYIWRDEAGADVRVLSAF